MTRATPAPTDDELAFAPGEYLATYYENPEERELRELKELVRGLVGEQPNRAPIQGAREQAQAADSDVDELLASFGYERAPG